ncbi:MAG TPA: hypothetical protein VHA56_13890 [Mucilaginibacter sp.]|nr:hypothetical protein [Mucilaginibacter sp.]
MNNSHLVFPAEVWGTVSDWVMIVVTTITAYFLYKTLRSQKDVQKAQNKLLQIEQVRLREDYKPALKYSRFEGGVTTKTIDSTLLVGKSIVSIAVMSSSDNHVLNIDIIFVDNEKAFLTRLGMATPINLFQKGKYVPLDFLVSSVNGYLLAYNFHFSITYEDVAGTKYTQRVFCFKTQDIEEIIASVPEVLN